MAQTTKRALAASLKKLLAEKPLDKITVTDVAEDCGVNRQTFYYHFKDIYDLLEWIYTSEASRVLGDQRTYDTWQQGYLRLFDYALENKALVYHTYHSAAREYLMRYLHEEAYGLVLGVVEEKAAQVPLRDEDKAFIATFYQYGLVGLLCDWIEAGMKEAPEHIADHLGQVIAGNIPAAIQRLRTDGARQKEPSV